MLTNKLYCLEELAFIHLVSMAEYNTACMLYLVIKELTKVLHIHLALTGINNNCIAIKLYLVCFNGANCLHNIAELTNTRGLYKHSVGVVLTNDLAKRIAKVTNKRAADTARIHLGDVYSRVLQKAAVYTDVTKLILNKNKLFTLVSLFYELVDKSSLSRTEKARNYIDLCHYYSFFRKHFIYK